MSFQVKSNGFEISIDSKGGAISLLDTFLAALGACAGYIFVDLLKASGCHWVISLQGVSLDESKRKSLLRFVRNYPVQETLKANPEMEINLIESNEKCRM